MSDRIVGKKIAPAAIHALKEALALIYWYKSDLRSFLTQSMSGPRILSKLNWDDYKRNIVTNLVDFLTRNEAIYQRQLMRLMTDVARLQNFSHLQRLDEGEAKAATAKAAVEALCGQIRGLEAFLEEEREIERRRQQAHEQRLKTDAVRTALKDFTREYCELLSAEDPQGRGYKLERLLRGLFELFDLDPRAAFRVVGEQIDGRFRLGWRRRAGRTRTMTASSTIQRSRSSRWTTGIRCPTAGENAARFPACSSCAMPRLVWSMTPELPAWLATGGRSTERYSRAWTSKRFLAALDPDRLRELPRLVEP